ncbi:Zn-ribbon domain-containing OB-fold protein [Nocardioides ferulae]|uniref:Zn-ribbon domain-containing OB-fold protein n=1 Tax=Nocardioides ferulae TaxID=2340821 RepID=UPI001980F049|nr:OB-fold domain-containing protein [Nocardioides ferulae]
MTAANATAIDPEAVPIAEDLFTWPAEEPALIGGKASDGSVVFPYRASRLVAGKREELEKIELPRRGALWTFTSQVFRPTSPPYAGEDDAKSFQPYTVGYVELPGGLRIEGRLTEPDPEKLTIGQEMEVVVLPFAHDAEGKQTVTYAFRPVDGTPAPKQTKEQAR